MIFTISSAGWQGAALETILPLYSGDACAAHQPGCHERGQHGLQQFRVPSFRQNPRRRSLGSHSRLPPNRRTVRRERTRPATTALDGVYGRLMTKSAPLRSGLWPTSAKNREMCLRCEYTEQAAPAGARLDAGSTGGRCVFEFG